MITWILLATLSCPKTVFENKSRYNWNDEDFKVYEKARVRCVEIYKKSPCVKKFIKRDKQDYSVVCGK